MRKLTYDVTPADLPHVQEDQISELDSRFKRVKKDVRGWQHAALFCLAIPIAGISLYPTTPVHRMFYTASGVIALGAAFKSKSQNSRLREVDERLWDETRVYKPIKLDRQNATIAEHRSYLQKIHDERYRPQKPQQEPNYVVQAPEFDKEWAAEKAVIEVVFRNAGVAVTVLDKRINRQQQTIEYWLQTTKGVKPKEIIEKRSELAEELYWNAGFHEKDKTKIYADRGKLILSVHDEHAPPLLNLQPLGTPVAVQEREPEYVQAQQPQPQSQAFSLNDGPSFTITRPDVSSIQMETIVTSNQPESMFPTEDVAKAIAQTTANVNSASSIFILAPRGCGKTGLLQTAMWETWQLWQSKVDFFIWAGKDDEKYCGIESDPDRYIYSGDKNNAEESVTRLEDYCDRRTAKATGYPTIFVKDENNNTLRACAGFDRIDSVNPKFKAYARMSEADYAVITKGRSKLCLNWMTAHDPRKESTGQSTGVFANVYSVILGRTADGSPMYGMMQECLTGASSNGVVDDKEQRDKLYLQFQEYRRRLNEGKEDGNRVLCLTNVGGLWRLVLLPIYQKDIHTINYKAEAEDPFETFDEQFEEKFGDDPDEIFEEQDDTDDPWEDKLEGSDPYEAIINWIKTNHPDQLSNPRFPDNNQLNELWQQWFKQRNETRDPLNQNGLNKLREVINAKRGLS